MTVTPWGDAATLRDRRLPSSTDLSPTEVAQNQRERLFAAMVAAVDEKGFEALTVADLLSLSGVSRTTFYELFDDKLDCFIAATEAIIEASTRYVEKRVERSGGGEAEARSLLEAFIDLIVAQPAASRMCFVESNVAGPGAQSTVQRGVGRFVALLVEADRAGRQKGLPNEVRRAIVGAVYLIVNARLYRREETELTSLMPQIWEWAISHRPPPGSLVPKPPRRNHALTENQARLLAMSHDPAERIVRGFCARVAEHGYPSTTIAEIAERASVSQSTFYSTFKGKKEVLLSAIDMAGAQMLAAMLPASRRGEDWPDSIRLALAAMGTFGAAEPDFASLLAYGIYSAGPSALVKRDEVSEGLKELFQGGYELAPDTPPIAAEAAVYGIYSLMYNQIAAGGPPSLAGIVPTAIYTSLLPFIGIEAAFERATA
jgi:AcrR family transcriptional regulator